MHHSNNTNLALAVGVTTFGDFVSFSGITLLFFKMHGLTYLALLQASSAISTIFLATFLGWLSDRFQVKSLLIISNLILGLLSILMYRSELLAIICLYMAKNLVLEISRNGTEKLIPLAVPTNELASYSAQLSIVKQVATIAGLSLGTIIAARFGFMIFLVDAATFFISMAMLSLLELKYYHLPRATLRHNFFYRSFISLTKDAAGYFYHKKAYFFILLVFVVCHLGWGMKDIVGIKLVDSYFKLSPSYYGFYSSVAVGAELLGAMIVSLYVGKKFQFRTWQAYLWSGILGSSFILNILFHQFIFGCLVKFLEGFASVITGLICGYYLVLKAPDEVRGLASGFIASTSALGLGLGKIFSSLLILFLPAQYIYCLFGLCILTLTLLVGVLHFHSNAPCESNDR